MTAVSRNVSAPSELVSRMKKIKGVNWSAVAVDAWELECRRMEREEGGCRYCGREYDEADKDPTP